MNAYQREMDAISRILAAFELLAARHGLVVPDRLRTVSGTRIERRAIRLEAMAGFTEQVALETIQTGLGAKLAGHGYTEIAVLRQTDDDDLASLDGIGKATVRALRKVLSPGRSALDRDIDAEEPLDLSGDSPSVEV